MDYKKSLSGLEANSKEYKEAMSKVSYVIVITIGQPCIVYFCQFLNDRMFSARFYIVTCWKPFLKSMYHLQYGSMMFQAFLLESNI